MNSISCKIQDWPIVRMHFPNNPTDVAVESWLNEIDIILERKNPCVVISTFDEHYQFSPEARKKQALWFKRAKAKLNQFCLGMVRVTHDEEMIKKITSNAMRQGMPFICTPASTLLEAEFIAKKILGLEISK